MAERISTPSKTKEIIEANRFAFKKNFGQNFLIDSNILDNIAACAGVTKEDCVLEIGPGIGSLTQVLAENAGQVVAVEIDNTLIPILKQTLADYDNIEILNQDILKTDIDAIIREKNDGRPIKVVANLPYYITTPIIMDLLENERHVDSITVMVQKEVAERMQARPKEKEYGALSIAVQYYCDAKLDMIVQPACFMPRPKVASAVITLKVLPERKVKTADEKLFFHLVKCAFGQRRKTLMNCLFHLGNLGFSKEELAELLEELGWDTDKLAAWGSSSGAHTALLMAMMPEYRERSLRIGAVVDYYGPAYLPAMIDYHSTSTEHLDELLGVPVKEHLDLAEKASPVSYLEGETPAVLILHGDKDKSCSFEQSVILYRRMREAGKDATMYRMHNAAHGGSPFWTPQVLDIVEAFLCEKLNWKKA